VHVRKRRHLTEKLDLVLVHPETGRGWVLETICKAVAQYFGGQFRIHYSLYRLPPARAYFFCHYSILSICLKRNPSIWGSKKIVFYTHPRDIGITEKELVYVLNKSDQVICMNSASVRELISKGVRKDKLSFVIGGADPQHFVPHKRQSGAVGFSTSYYSRKSPDLILNIIRRMPHRRFILLGPQASDESCRHREWSQYERFNEMLSLANFSYIEAPYSDYPRYYNEMDVFVLPSKLEGGPIPLIEAMMSNVVPVASRTGFAPDIIHEGENGFLFDVDSPAEEICELIDKAYEVQADIRSTVEHLTWKNFSRQIQGYL